MRLNVPLPLDPTQIDPTKGAVLLAAVRTGS